MLILHTWLHRHYFFINILGEFCSQKYTSKLKHDKRLRFFCCFLQFSNANKCLGFSPNAPPLSKRYANTPPPYFCCAFSREQLFFSFNGERRANVCRHEHEKIICTGNYCFNERECLCAKK